MRTLSIAATATATALAAATAGVGLLVTAPGAASADATKSSAYGLQVSAGGQEVVPPTPYVESTDGSTKQVTGGALPANPLGLSATIGELTAGDDFASVELTNVGLAPDSTQLPPAVQQLLTDLGSGCEEVTAPLQEGEAEAEEEATPEDLPLPAELEPLRETLTALLGEDFELGDLRDFCDSFDPEAPLVTIGVLSVDCEGDQGGVELARVQFLGQTIPVPAVPQNQPIIPENPLVTITANHQTTTADGGFSVDGLHVSLVGGEAEAVVANATCGETIAAPAVDTPAPPAAPAPAPVPASAPVTG